MKKSFILFVSVLILLLGTGSLVFAQTPEPIEPPIPIEPPPIDVTRITPPWQIDGLTIEYQRVDVSIENQVATTHIDQLFVNDNEWMLEGTYLFPLPEGAAISQLTMWVDGQPIEAKILERDEARQIYDNIVRQLRDPALLEYVGTQAVQANVFPIPPHDERRIEIEYTQVLPADNGVVHYVFPQSTKLYTNAPLDNQSIRVDVRSNEAIRAIYSPSHPVAVSREGDYRAIVGYEASAVVADQDFELYYTVTPEDIGLNLLSYKEAGEDGFFLLLVAPSVEATEVIAKDVILVMDTSGSMEGEKIQQAQQAASYVIEHLKPGDRFNIVPFSTGVRTYQPELVPAEQPGNYQAFINSLEALGGTNISQALLEAANMVDPQRPTTIIFLTDGLATEGIVETPLLLDAVGQAMPTNARIFAFGVGDDVDPNLLDALAENHRGTTTYVRPFQAIDEEVSSFYAKVSTPVLADISLDFGGVTVEQMYPDTLPDLFAGTQLVLAGRYREGGPATITLRGTVNGEPQVFIYEDNLFHAQGGDDFIPRLWATRAIGHLLREIRLRGEEPELVQSVVNLSIRYGIITPYTSYLIEEDDIFTQTGRQTIAEDAVEVTRVVTEGVVEEAAAAADMAAAEAPLALPTLSPNATNAPGEAAPNTTGEVKVVGSKTFVLRDGVWIDTAYDPERTTPQPIGFASDAYFDLLAAVPELGQYLAIGPRVLVLAGSQAYEIVPEGEGVETAVLPDQPTAEINPAETAVPAAPASEETPLPASPDAPAKSSARTGICATIMVLPLFLVTGLVIGRYGQWSSKRK
ncbi:MAG: VWA domain-containing protein [Anaerolineales bacterium]|nr:VWA domain-containing protein [Anaerolineales bacterium]